MEKVDLSIIVTSYQNAAVLDLCLKSIMDETKRLLKKRGLHSEVVVVDGEAGEKTRDVAKKYILDNPRITYCPFSKNMGFPKLVNKGLKESSGDYILILNSDIILTEGSLGEMLRYLKTHRKTGILGPKLLNFDGSPQASAFHFYTPLIILYRRTLLGKTPWGKKKLAEHVIDLSAETEPISINGWLMGSALMVRRDNLEKVGLMDERYFMYFEDVDWCRRFKEQGFNIIYFPIATLFHYHGKQSTTRHFWEALFNKYTAIHILSALKYFWKFRKSSKLSK
jgi:N-acetylglucosaminyl-diphospho-decaprenol L-rhamnosyltransferase